MNILLLTAKFPPEIGGVPKYYKNLIINLKQTAVTVITRLMANSGQVDAEFNERGIIVKRVTYFPGSLGPSFKLTWLSALLKLIVSVVKICNHGDIDLIVIGQAKIFFLLPAYCAKILFGIPYLVFLHGEEIPQIPMRKNTLLKKLYERGDGYLCNSLFTAKRLEKFLNREDVQYTIITPGVEDKLFHQSDYSKIAEQLNLNGKRVLYTIARLEERKGQDMVIEALPLVIREFPNVLYLIGGEGPRQAHLQALVNQRKLEDYVRFLGSIPEKYIVVYHQCGEIFLHPNRTLKDGDSEGFGIVFLEANAVGNPVIGGRAGGAQDAVIDSQTGLLVNPEQPQDIAEKICWLLTHPDQARRMGKHGRERAWNEFRWEKLAEKFEQALQRFV